MSILKKLPNVYISKLTLDDLLLLPVPQMELLLQDIQKAPGQVDEITFQIYKVIDNRRVDWETLQDLKAYMSNP